MKPVVICICDGFGAAAPGPGNAISLAHTPCFDALYETCPHTLLEASGLSVGLPCGQMGNSEVGHTNIGAGRIVYQDLTRITKSIDDGDFFENPALLAAMENAKKGALHLFGLLSDGGVHSHLSHLFALLQMAKRRQVERVYLHCFLDGRDVSPTSGLQFVKTTQAFLSELGLGSIATLCGRYYAMDRDNRWDRVEKAYRALVLGEGERAQNPALYLALQYEKGVTDEFIPPAVCDVHGMVCPNDSVVFFNFRPDRARELTRAFCDRNFSGFALPRGHFPLHYCCLTQYDAEMPGVTVAFAPEDLRATLGEVVSNAGLRQLRIAETEKYAHVTFFFNGGIETPYPLEERVLVPSPAVATYDLQPEMSAPEVTRLLIEQLEKGPPALTVLNFANCDMVGHTGNLKAAVKAVETVDASVAALVKTAKKAGVVCLITADHGNADQMLAKDGSPFTAHTTNPVPLFLVGEDCALRSGGRLCDIAPTVLELMGLEKPPEMTGESLLVR